MRPTTYYRPDGRVEILVGLDVAPRVFIVDGTDVARIDDLIALADWHRERRLRSRTSVRFGLPAEALPPAPSPDVAAARRSAKRRLPGA